MRNNIVITRAGKPAYKTPKDMETKTYNWVAVFGITETVTEMWYDYTEGAARRKAERRAKKWNCTVRIFKQTNTIINDSLKVK